MKKYSFSGYYNIFIFFCYRGLVKIVSFLA
jgi:hypothetical protein